MIGSRQQQQHQQQQQHPNGGLNYEHSNPTSGHQANTTLRKHCLPHSLAPPRHIRVAVNELILPRPLQSEYPIDLSVQDADVDGENNDGNLMTTLRCSHVYSNEEVELRVEAKLWCMGMPVHSFVIGTHRQEPFDVSSSGVGMRKGSGDGRRHRILWNDTLSFPFRWRDLTRDACITFEVLKVVHSPNLHKKSEQFNNSKLSEIVGGTTLHLFDETGMLRTGRLKLMVYPDVSGKPLNIFNTRKDATPGIALSDSYIEKVRLGDEAKRDLEFKGYSKEMEKHDPEWVATNILNQLQPVNFNEVSYDDQTSRVRRHVSRRTNFSSTATVVSGNSSEVAATGSQLSPEQNKKPSWLDELTIKRCKDILADEKNFSMDVYHSTLSNGVEYTLANSMFLMVELPTFVIPVVFEENLYSVNNRGHHGASGSVTALDLSLYKHRKSYMSSVLSATSSLISNTIQDGQEMGRHSLGLIHILDPENEDNNPVEEKYRTLARDALRGLVDPALKPDRFQQQRIAAIISSPSHHLTMEEKDIIWRFRFSLVDNRKALTKFLLAVDWTVEAEVVQASELLGQWRKRSPIEVTDALKLLGKHVAFQTNLVRSYAIDTLNSSSDEELSLYLLQLVQALKYEHPTPVTSVEDEGKQDIGNISLLASFLIERASKNQRLANYLYWYLRVELNDPTHGQKYRNIYLALEDKLSISPSCRTDEGFENNEFVSSLAKPLPISPTTVTIWEVLLAQDKYFTELMDALVSARNEPGRKPEKVAKFRELLFARGLDKIAFAPDKTVPLPSAPTVFVEGVNPLTATMFKSALYPALLEFNVAPPKTVGHEMQSQRVSSERSSFKLIVKAGDDLRQDQLVMQVIYLMDGLLKRSTLDLRLRPYSIIATNSSPPAGLVEYVEGSLPVSAVLAQYNNSILKFLQHFNPQKSSELGVTNEAMQNYVRSCAGYCVITYLMGVGDRHLDNIMLLQTGQLFHIDFGFIFGRDPKPLPPPFRLTREMVDAMGGVESNEYRLFCSLACQAYNVLRKHAGLILNLLHLMSDAGIEDLPSESAEAVIEQVEERFRLDLTDTQAEGYFSRLIYDSLNSFAPRVMEAFHRIAVARR